MEMLVPIAPEAAQIPTDLITIKKAAGLLAVHVTTVYGIIRRGDLRAWKRVGGHARVSRADVLNLLVPVQIHAAAGESPRAASEEEVQSAAAVSRLRGKDRRYDV